jgi:hypothetical protein
MAWLKFEEAETVSLASLQTPMKIPSLMLKVLLVSLKVELALASYHLSLPQVLHSVSGMIENRL